MSNQLVKGPGAGTMEWRENFVLTDTDGVTAKFSVDQTTGNVVAAGTITSAGAIDNGGNLSLAGNIAVNTNKFTVAGASGNTVVAGTLGVTGRATLSADPVLSHTSSPLATDPGVAGEVTWDASFGYICLASGNWARFALTAGY